ncbi:MAG: hypothetical protein AAGD38_19400 [Acidobacteriota bacterium]
MSDKRESRRLAEALKTIVRRAYEEGWIDEEILERELDWPSGGVVWWLEQPEHSDSVVTMVAIVMALGGFSRVDDDFLAQPAGPGQGFKNRIGGQIPTVDPPKSSNGTAPYDPREVFRNAGARRLLRMAMETLGALIDNGVYTRGELIADLEHYLGAQLRFDDDLPEDDDTDD